MADQIVNKGITTPMSLSSSPFIIQKNGVIRIRKESSKKSVKKKRVLIFNLKIMDKSSEFTTGDKDEKPNWGKVIARIARIILGTIFGKKPPVSKG